ncbi:MAG: beta-carboxysome assembly chaperone CcmS [Microcystaceae cyanobacterium]
MLPLGVSIPDDAANQWRFQLDDFVKVHEQALAALAWGLQTEWQDDQAFLGIDLLPSPHFICWEYADLVVLNDKVQNKIQEILGIVANYDRRREVLLLAIASGQLKLLFFEPALSPAESFEQYNGDLDHLIKELEAALAKIQLS